MRIVILVFLLPWIGLAQIPVPASGQCQAICLSKYAVAKEYFTMVGDPYQDIDVSNNTDFSLCKLGCHQPNFNELVLPAFKIGQQAYNEVIDKSSQAPLTASPIESITLLCVDLHSNATIVGRLILDLTQESAGQALVHYIEAIRRDDQMDTEAVFWQLWSYSPIIDFSSTLPASNQSIQFRVTSFNKDGLMGQLQKSRWISQQILLGSARNQIDVIVEKVMWREETASVRLLFPRLGLDQLTVCSVKLSYETQTGHVENIKFSLDRSRGILLDRLAFDTNYNIHVSPNTVTSKAATANETIVHAPVPSCLSMVTDASMCAPPPVDSIEWKWNRSRTDFHTLNLTWIYYLPTEFDIPTTKRSASPLTMVHFDIETRALATDSQPQCQHLENQRRVVTWAHRSVLLYIQDDRCNYEVGITVVDTRNRRSPMKKTQILRYTELKGMLAMTTAQWNFEMFLLVVFLLALLIVAGGMAVCRIRERSEFNTLKREHRQLTKSIVVAQSASTLPRSQCLTIVDGRGRPISSDESDILPYVSTQHMMSSKSPQFYPDEGVYDSLDTPTRSEASYFDRLSSCSLTRANPIYAGINLHGVMALPFDKLHVSQYLRSNNKGWSSCHAIDKSDGSAFLMKYSGADDSQALKHELGIISRISTDHPGLLYFQGLAVKDSQALGVLFEPIRGGTLSSFLADVRVCLFDRRNDNTPSPASSGYDGSNQSQESLDRFQHRIDRLTVHLYTFAKQIASALNFLHLQNAMHCSITSESVYLLKSYRDPLHLPCDQMAKLGDYDHAVHGDSPLNIAPINLPPAIIPPEVMSGKPFTTHGDIWQFGLLLSEIVTLGVVNSLWETSEGTISDKAIKNFYSRLSTGHDNSLKIDPGLVQLKQKITRCLMVDYKKRISAKDLVKELSDIQPQPSLREHMESVEV